MPPNASKCATHLYFKTFEGLGYLKAKREVQRLRALDMTHIALKPSDTVRASSRGSGLLLRVPQMAPGRVPLLPVTDRPATASQARQRKPTFLAQSVRRGAP